MSSVNDTFPESDEDFILSLTTTDGGINLTPDEASVTIMDDDDSRLHVFVCVCTIQVEPQVQSLICYSTYESQPEFHTSTAAN